MKRILVTALILTGLFQANTQAQTVDALEIKTNVAKILQADYNKIIDGDVEVKITGTQFRELQLPDGEITYKVVGEQKKISPRDIKRIDVFVNGAFIRTLNLPVQTIIYKEVLVASDFINRDQTLTKDCTSVKRVDVSMHYDQVLKEEMLNKEITTKKAFFKGEVIDKRFVKFRPDVIRNAEVRVFFVSNKSVMISIDGTAMSDGMLGDYIDVENKNYKKVYNGKIIGENKVLVNI